MSIWEQMNIFSGRYGKNIIVQNQPWHYYRLGTGTPILWLTGGLRRAALGFAFMERLARNHTVIAPDYPPVATIGEYIAAFEAILQTEGIETLTLGGQSYGGMLAQAYLAHKGKADVRGRAVERLILSEHWSGRLWESLAASGVSLHRTGALLP